MFRFHTGPPPDDGPMKCSGCGRGRASLACFGDLQLCEWCLRTALRFFEAKSCEKEVLDTPVGEYP